MKGEEEEEGECFAEGIVQPLAAAVLGSMRSSQSIVQACYCRPMRGTNTGLRKRRVHNACRNFQPDESPEILSMHKPEDIRNRARRYSMPLPEDTVCEARSNLSELDPT